MPRGVFCTDWRLVLRAALVVVREVFFAEERAEGCEGRGDGEAREERVAGHTREGPGEHRGEAAAAGGERPDGRQQAGPEHGRDEWDEAARAAQSHAEEAPFEYHGAGGRRPDERRGGGHERDERGFAPRRRS